MKKGVILLLIAVILIVGNLINIHEVFASSNYDKFSVSSSSICNCDPGIIVKRGTNTESGISYKYLAGSGQTASGILSIGVETSSLTGAWEKYQDVLTVNDFYIASGSGVSI